MIGPREIFLRMGQNLFLDRCLIGERASIGRCRNRTGFDLALQRSALYALPTRRRTSYRRALHAARRERCERAYVPRVDAEEAQVSRRASERHKMAALCAHMGASIAGKAVVAKSMKKPAVVGRSVAMPARASAAGVPGRATRLAGDCGVQNGVVRAKKAQRGKVRAPESGIHRPPLSHSLDKEGLGLKSQCARP